jgi:NTE family protein
MATRALVLGAGGPVTVAWEVGLVAGLAQEGVMLGDADLFVGTSAGAAVSAMLALGWSPQQMLGALAALNAPSLTTATTGGPADMMQIMQQAAVSGASPESVAAQMGALALGAQTIGEEDYVATVGSALGHAPWPERRYTCGAVDTTDGSFAAWNNDSGVELARAIASSTAVPGIFPPITINDRRYMDGGVRSATNADLARGYEVVVLVAIPLGTDPAMLEAARRQLDGEMNTLREGGGTVALIMPDATSLEAMGLNLMDFSRAAGAIEPGMRQGATAAAWLRDMWGVAAAPGPTA